MSGAYIVSGKLGAGKSLVCVGKIQDALKEGRKVATNLDLRLENLLPLTNKTAQVYRMPDFPGVEDFEAVGMGNESMDEDKNGLMVLDELSLWLNAREFGDKGRLGILKWLALSRKHGWDVYFIAQSAKQVDSQLRESFVDYLVYCKRLDRLQIPLVGTIAKLFTKKGLRLPRVHLGIVKYGIGHDAPVAERWVYRGTDLFEGYDTRQRFFPKHLAVHAGTASMLSPWHIKGRYLQPEKPSFLTLFLRGLMGKGAAPADRREAALRPRLPLVDLITRLPPEQRIAHWKRLSNAGAI